MNTILKMDINITADFPQIERHYIRSYLFENKNFSFYCCVAFRCLKTLLCYKEHFDMPLSYEGVAEQVNAYIVLDSIYPQHLYKHTTVENEEQVKQSKKALAYLTVQEAAKKYPFFEDLETPPENMITECDEFSIKPVVPKILEIKKE